MKLRRAATASGSPAAPRPRHRTLVGVLVVVLLTALLIGFAISLFQSVTQIQEATLSFVPKAAGVGAAILFSGNWMLHEMVSFTTQLFEKIPVLIG